jgi:hypothetical protein
MSACSFHSVSDFAVLSPPSWLALWLQGCMVNCTGFPSVSFVLTHPSAPIPLQSHAPPAFLLYLHLVPPFCYAFLFLPYPTPLALPSFVPAQFHPIPLIRWSLRHASIELLQGKDRVIHRTFPISQSSKRPRYAESPFPCLILNPASFTNTTLHSHRGSWADIRSS